MNQVLEFLSENYIYVAGGSLVLIIILIIIIALGNKKKKKIENAGMVNFNDMQVGSVTDVAQNMNQMNPNMPHTQNVSDVQLNNQAINSIGNSVVEPTTIPIQPQNEPLMQNNNVGQPNMSVQNFGVAPVELSPINTPVETAPVEPSPINTPVEPAPVESSPINIPVEPAPVEPSPINTPVEPAPVESSPINTPVEPAPVEPSPINTPVEPAPVESSPINTPVEPLEMFGIEEVPSQAKGSAVAGFSSVNIEK